ncbi:MAG: ParB N-terminal domain-containing protein, partial [Actinobacteria bacterium]|nr:ParB N-terminal domain-containing protein [Actinomycetota bacterium]
MKAKFITIEAGKIKPNPFKKYIEEGGLSETIIEGLIESFKQTIFHDNLAARENKEGEIELIYGHHRLEAVKRYYGKDYQINLKVYFYEDFTDEKMLIDMIRENLTQRGQEFKEMLHSVL